MENIESTDCVWESDESDLRPGYGTEKTLWCVTHDSAHLPEPKPSMLHPIFMEALRPFAPVLFDTPLTSAEKAKADGMTEQDLIDDKNWELTHDNDGRDA